MLLGLAFGNNNANTSNTNNNQDPITLQNSGGTGFDPGLGTDPGDTGGDTIPYLQKNNFREREVF